MNIEEMVVSHIGWIMGRAAAMCECRDDAQDLAQDTILKLLVNRDKFNPSMDFKPWTLAIMSNTWKSETIRRKRVQTLCPVDCETPAESASAMAGCADIFRIVTEAKGECVGIEAVMLFAAGYNYSEIAEIQHIGIGTVKSRLAAGRRLLRKKLSE